MFCLPVCNLPAAFIKITMPQCLLLFRTDFPDEELKWKACRSIGAFLPQWSSCLKSFKITGNLTTPESTSAWETLSSEPFPSASSIVFETLSLDGVVTSTDCLASHFSESNSSGFFARLSSLDIRLRGDYEILGLPVKSCPNLRRFSLAFEYFSESTPFQIGRSRELNV